MRAVLDELRDGQEIWYEVYLVDSQGNILCEKDEVFTSLDRAIDYLRGLVDEFICCV